MKYVAYSHCAGDNALPAALRKEIVTAITAITVKPTRGLRRSFAWHFLDALKGRDGLAKLRWHRI